MVVFLSKNFRSLLSVFKKKAGQKQDEQRKLTVHYRASQHTQENVFIEGSRSKYLEDLHTEAQEGLKILQQEEHSNGVDFRDDQSVSTVSPQEKDCQEKDGHLDLDSTAEHSITSASSRSAVSSRPVLTRQGSTFKPLNTVKRLDKAKKRPRRTTIMGIPQQVQREICMGRGVLLQQLPNGEDDNSPGTVIIPTIDGGRPLTNYEGARVHLHDIEALQESRHEQILRHHIQAVYTDDLLQTCKLGPRASPMQRPKSLAVPGITTSSSFLQEPQGPVMSISPQATYLSTIIPNAVLPPAIDVIEIDRSRSRRSVRTISKSSLASASPGSSRSGGGTHDAPPSNSSKWSHSQSSETIISNSSTISLRGNAPPAQVTDSMNEGLKHKQEQRSLKSSSNWLSSSTKESNHKQEQEELSEAVENIRNSQLFSRSLSVTKAKLPPAPPRRTFSLHQEKLKQKTRELVDTKDLNSLESNSGQINGDISAKEEHTSSINKQTSSNSQVSAYLDDSHSSLTFSPDSPEKDFTDAPTGSGNSSPQDKFERTMSPSSGYSSQSGTPTHSSKDICPTSPGKHKVKPPKPERMGARTSPVVSVSSSMTSLTSVSTDTANLSTQTHTTQSQQPKVSPVVTAVTNKTSPPGSVLRELFNIPPPPKVKAPCPPPPETWVHNKRTVELLCGPILSPNRIYMLQEQHQKDSLLMQNQSEAKHTDQERQVCTVIKNKHLEVKEVTTDVKNELISLQKEVTLDKNLASRHIESPLINEKEEESNFEMETASCNIEKQEQNFKDVKKDQESPITLEKVPSDKADPRMLSPTPVELQLKREDDQCNASDLLVNVTLTTKTDETDKGDKHFIQNCIEVPYHTATENLLADTSRVTSNSPPPSPPPAHHPPPPPSKKSHASSVSIPSTEEELQPDTEIKYTILECSWPPPPPPMEVTVDLFEGQDEIDFPPPPPPVMNESLSTMLDHCNVESTGQGDNFASEDSYVPDTDSHPEVTPELHILGSTMPVQAYNKQAPADATLNVPEASEIPRHFQQMPQKIPPQPPEGPPNPPFMSAQDSSKQVACEVSVLTSDVATDLPLAMEDPSTVNFRRQQSLMSKDNKSKELLSKHKSAPISKEDANIPLVTPSLLQMVRLRSVNVEDQVSILSQDDGSDMEAASSQDQGTSNQVIPQKPIRKSCFKSTQPLVKSSPTMVVAPSMRLQEAIRMKTAAMSSGAVPAMLSLRLPTSTTNSNDIPVQAHKTLESCDMLKSPASTASFIFSKSTKKVVIETPKSPEVQAALKQNLAAELMQISDQTKSMVTNESKKQVKVPPPVAKKPAHATNCLDKLGTATALTTESSLCMQTNGAENGHIETVQPAGQQAQSPRTMTTASTTETASTLEVSQGLGKTV